jgi:hypothetical protein
VGITKGNPESLAISLAFGAVFLIIISKYIKTLL